MKHKLLIAAFVATLAVSFAPLSAYAADPAPTDQQQAPAGTEKQDNPEDWKPKDKSQNCALLPAEICTAADQEKGKVKESALFLVLVWVLNILTAAVGVAAVGALVYAGIIYTSAGGDSSKVQKAKQIITDTVIGIVAYGLMYLALNWLIPGGVIG